MNIQFPHFLATRIVAILSQMVTAIKSRPIIVSLAALLIALFPAVAVFAGHETGTVPSYTGCLNPGGTIYNVALGETPSKPCITDHPTIHLSGGDITAVTAGTGLTGGGSEGAVTLAVDTSQVQMRVSGDCDFLGGAISKIDETGQVICSNGPAAFYLFNDGMHDTSDDGEMVGSLSLVPGSYLIHSKINFHIEFASIAESFWGITCRLQLEPGFIVDAAGAGGDTDLSAGATLSMLAVIDLQDPASVEVWCLDAGDQPGQADFEWSHLKLSVLQLGAAQVTEVP